MADFNSEKLVEYLNSEKLEEDYNKIIKALGDKADDILLIIHLKHKKEFTIALDKIILNELHLLKLKSFNCESLGEVVIQRIEELTK